MGKKRPCLRTQSGNRNLKQMGGKRKKSGGGRAISRVPVKESDKPGILKVSDDGSISGSVEEIVYRNDLNGYTVINFGTQQYLIVAVGVMPDISEGEKLNIWGDWETNPKYGRQFKVMEYTVVVPSGGADLERYLASGAIRGIGPKTASRIISAFGDDASDVMENHPEWLSQIPGITLKRAREISKEFKEKSDVRAVITFFRGFLGPSMTMKAYRHFGRNVIETAKTAPYRFCDEIEGISFEKADRMAEKIGIDRNTPERISSGLRYVLRSYTSKEGHTCLPENLLLSSAVSELKVNLADVSDTLKKLIASGVLVSEIDPVTGERMIFEREVMDNEEYIARKLILLNRGSAPLDFADIRGLIRKAEAEIGIHFDDGQKKAIISALSRGVLILTGGPGTGKTTVITALLNIFEGMGFKVALCAPTGRAAKRMAEATGREARTVHRLLEVNLERNAEDDEEEDRLLLFRRDENNLLDEHIVILDEASMLDTALCAALLRAVRPGGRLILIGDSDQLPSVGAGNVLGDIISSGTLPLITLTHIFRQAGESLIVTNAHRINSGEMPDLNSSNRDFFFLPRSNNSEVAETVADLCSRRLPAAYGDDEVIQVISPSRKGQAGVENLNSIIQTRMNPEGPGKREYRYGQYTFRKGDRVMQIRNNYTMDWENGARHGQGVFNGDIGVIDDINLSARYMDIDFEGRNVAYSFSELDDLEPAYAITVHKSQGSEYSTVVIPVGDVPPALRTRNLLYTAVTRAQNRVIMVGFESTVSQMVGNYKPMNRYTGLARRLREKSEIRRSK